MSKKEAQAAQEGRPKLWTPVFVLVIACTLCSFIMGMGLNSGTTVYLTAVGYGSSLAGVLALVFSLSAAVVRLLAGAVVDAGKCSLAYAGGLAVVTGGALMCAFAEGVAALAVARVLQGAGFSLATTSLAAAAADILPKERLGEGIGYAGLGQALAMSVGPAFALFLVGTDPAANLFFGLAMVGTLGFCIALFARYEKKAATLPPTCAFVTRGNGGQRKKAPSARGLAGIFEPRALPGTLPMAVLTPLNGFGIFFVGAYGASLGYDGAGLFFTVSALAMIAVRLCSGSFMDRVPALVIFGVACAAGLVCCGLLLAGGSNQVLFVAAGAFYGTSLGLAMPVSQTVVNRSTPSERWGAANALFFLLYDVVIGVFCAIWGFVNESFGYSVTICCTAALVALAFVVACVVYPADQKRLR